MMGLVDGAPFGVSEIFRALDFLSTPMAFD